MAEELLDHKQLKILFAKLLGSKEGWVPFTNNVWKIPANESDGFTHKNDLNLLFKQEPSDWLEHAFEWGGTSEKFDYWSRLNDRWLDILEINNDDYKEPEKWKNLY